MKIVTLAIFICAVCVKGDASAKDSRQKRLLFYDENGSLVKTYSNPYPNNPFLQNLRLNAGHLPYYGSYLNPFFGFIKDFGNIFSLTIPVSNEVIQQIQRDPAYHNKLMLTHTPDPVIEPNPLCEGKRSQIPSPKLCNNYLNCWDGWAVEQECPPGLLFSSQGYCDYSDSVNCESRKLREQPPTQPQCRKDFEAFRSSLDCKEFFICVGRQPVKFKCPADLSYNQELGVCDYPSRVDCSSAATNTDIFAPQSTSVQPAAPTPEPMASPAPLPPSSDSPSAAILPLAPIAPTATFSPPASPIVVAAPTVLKPGVIKTVFSDNSIVNTQSWSSTHIAMSRQDAIRQLQLGNIAKVEA
ncbi:hypothetical protein PYW07_014793 [Mythimna separata]|uniref:Chitin-binding type-2 domain-containing protein n=1 Tax=Mythimna separata TaxID=271217 RepID=A0AAD8DZ85_MYTSE|nr:hypothetical protein PYW07_014793 [Mythimna separata]